MARARLSVTARVTLGLALLGVLAAFQQPPAQSPRNSSALPGSGQQAALPSGSAADSVAQLLALQQRVAGAPGPAVELLLAQAPAPAPWRFIAASDALLAQRSSGRAPVRYGVAEPRFALQLDGGGVITVALSGARPAPARHAHEHVVYQAAAPGGGDIVMRPLAAGTKDFIRYAQPPDEQRARYRLALPAGYRARHYQQSGVHFYPPDSEDAAAIMGRPQIWDRQGVTHPTSVRVDGCDVDADAETAAEQAAAQDGCAIEVSWDVDAARYPIVLDPEWISVPDGQRPHFLFMTATPLSKRRVLICGGFGSFPNPLQALAGIAPTSDCDLYVGSEQVNGSGEYLTSKGWPKKMTRARTAHTATELDDGRILFAGGHIEPARQELFNPITEQFTVSGEIWAEPRMYHSAVKLQDGRVLIAGGAKEAAALKTAYLFDPQDGSWTATPPMAQARQSHAAALLDNGWVIVIGGLDFAPTGNDPVFLTTTEVYVPGARGEPGGWYTGPEMAVPRGMFTIHRSGDQLYALGGWSASAPIATNSIERLDVSSFEGRDPTQLSQLSWLTNLTSLATARLGHGQAELGSTLVVSGGFDGSAHDTTEFFAVGPGDELVVSPQDCSAGICDMLAVRIGHTATTVPELGRVLVVGGLDTAGDSSELLTPIVTTVGGRCFGDAECPSQRCRGGHCCAQPKMADMELTGCVTCDENGTASTLMLDMPEDTCLDSGAECTFNGLCSATGCAQYAGPGCTPNGCAKNIECASGYCVDGVCCDSECEGLCNVCNLEGSRGICTLSPAGTSCGEQGLELVCSPEGSCGAKLESGVACAADAQCQTGLCIDGVCCTGLPGQSDCGNYRCGGAGQCLSPCSSPRDCVGGFTCGADGACVPVSAVGSPSGCSVQVPPSKKRSAWPLLMMLTWLCVRRRRRAA